MLPAYIWTWLCLQCYVAIDVTGPGGTTVEEFKSLAFDVGSWMWGTLQGAFNEEATLSQIVTDAVIGMIPLVGDVTAARDLIAVTIGLCNDPKKREDKFQWILLVILIFALIPVIGGVVKGVGRLVLKAMGEVAQLAGAARAAKMAESAKDIVAFLNRVGIGNAEKWLVELKFAAHQSDVVAKFDALLGTIMDALRQAKTRWGAHIPQRFVLAIDSLVHGLARLKEEAARRIPDAIKELDQFLREIQAYVRSGGETTSQTISRTATAGAPNLSYADELKILEEGKGALRSVRGGLAANSPLASDLPKVYTPEPGYPDILAYKVPGPKGDSYPNIATMSGKVVNRQLRKGEKVFRVFGPEGTTHGFAINGSLAAGSRSPAFWGLNDVPKNAEEWRHLAAVRDEWNRNGLMIVGTVIDDVPACIGKIAEQFSDSIPGQYLRGGGKQAMLDLPQTVRDQINALGSQMADVLQKTGKAPAPVTHTVGGVHWEVRATGWDDVNGIHGYLNMPGPTTVQSLRLGAREQASKKEE